MSKSFAMGLCIRQVVSTSYGTMGEYQVRCRWEGGVYSEKNLEPNAMRYWKPLHVGVGTDVSIKGIGNVYFWIR